MHTLETKWQDRPLELEKKLREVPEGFAMSALEYYEAAATIKAMVSQIETLLMLTTFEKP